MSSHTLATERAGSNTRGYNGHGAFSRPQQRIRVRCQGLANTAALGVTVSPDSTIARRAISKTTMSKAIERANLRPSDYRLYMALVSRSGKQGAIPDSRQPQTVEALARTTQYSTGAASEALRHLVKHGWVARAKGTLAGYAFTRYAVMIGSDCDCPRSSRIGVPLTDRERSHRYRERKLGHEVDVPPEPGGRTAVYRMFAFDGALLYIGISNDFGRRWLQHEGIQPWWPETQRQTVDWFPTRTEALRAEKAAIITERPKYNVTFSVTGEPESPPVWDHEADDVLWDLYLETEAAG